MFVFAELFRTFLQSHHRERINPITHKRLLDHFAVDAQFLVDVGHGIAGQSHDTLDVIHRFIHRIAEHHHVASLRGADVNDLCVGNRQTNAVCVLIHQNEVADVKGRQHRSRWNAEGFKKEGTQQEHDQNHREESCRVIQPPGHACVTRIHIVARLDDACLTAIDGFAVGGLKFPCLGIGLSSAARTEVKLLGNPHHAGKDRQKKQNQCKVHFFELSKAI